MGGVELSGGQGMGHRAESAVEVDWRTPVYIGKDSQDRRRAARRQLVAILIPVEIEIQVGDRIRMSTSRGRSPS